MKNSLQQLKGITIATVFFFGLLYVQAWTGAPAGTPPANNVDAPINVGVVTQLKSGALGIDGLFRSYGSAIFDGSVKISTGAGSGKVLTSDADGNASWQTTAPVSSGGGGGSSPYCAFSGQSKSVQAGDSPNFQFKVATCAMSVDSSGFQTITVSGGNIDFTKCSETRNNQDSLSCSFTSMYDTQASANVSFDRNTGVMTCVYSDPSGGGTHTNNFTFTKDQSKCAGAGSAAETDPTVLTSVKDGVSWSEITGTPSVAVKGSVLGGCTGGTDCWGQINPPNYPNRCPAGSTARTTGTVDNGMGGSDQPGGFLTVFLCIKN